VSTVIACVGRQVEVSGERARVGMVGRLEEEATSRRPPVARR
jgi:hypothetical protein